MNDNLPVKMGNPLAALGIQLNTEPEELKRILKATAFKLCTTDEQFLACVMVAQAYKLNPLLRQIYAFIGQNGEVVPIVPIDGWIQLVQTHPAYDGVEQQENFNAAGELVSVTTTFHRKDQTRPTVHTEYLRECYRDTGPWKKWTIRMLDWKSYIQTGRIAFGFAGIFDEDEAIREEQPASEKGKPMVAMPQERAIEQEPPREVVETVQHGDPAKPTAAEVAEAQTQPEPIPGDPGTLPGGGFKDKLPPSGLKHDPTDEERKARGWISRAQEKRLWAKAKSYQVLADTVRAILEKKGIKDSSEVPWRIYEQVIDEIQAAGTPPAVK